MAFGARELKAVFTLVGVEKAKMEMQTFGTTGAASVALLNTQVAQVGIAMAALASGALAVKGTLSLIAQGGELKGIASGFAAVGGSATLMRDLQMATEGTVAQVNLMQSAIKGLNANLSPEQLVRLTEAANTLSDVGYGELVPLLETLIPSASAGSGRALKQFGINVKEDGIKTTEDFIRALEGLTKEMSPDDGAADAVDNLTASLKDMGDQIKITAATLAQSNGLTSLLFDVASGIRNVNQQLQDGATLWELYWLAISGQGTMSGAHMRGLAVREQSAAATGHGPNGTTMGVSNWGLDRTPDSLIRLSGGSNGGGGGGAAAAIAASFAMGNKLNWSRFGAADMARDMADALGIIAGAERTRKYGGASAGPSWGPFGSGFTDATGVGMFNVEQMSEAEVLFLQSTRRQGPTTSERQAKGQAMKRKAGMGGGGGYDFDTYAGYAQSAANIYGMASSGNQSGAWLELGYTAADIAVPGLGTALRTIGGAFGIGQPHQRQTIQDAAPVRLVNPEDITGPIIGAVDQLTFLFSRGAVAGGVDALNARHMRAIAGRA